MQAEQNTQSAPSPPVASIFHLITLGSDDTTVKSATLQIEAGDGSLIQSVLLDTTAELEVESAWDGRGSTSGDYVYGTSYARISVVVTIGEGKDCLR